MDAPSYAASCNPPRRAKRPRTASDAHAHTPALQPILPAAATPPSSPPAAADPPAPKRRGRKPSTLSRAARESMRRQNHSRIEKARRTKINDALATLRALVPAGARRAATPDDSEDGEDEDEYVEGKRRKGAEKEFKLEVLERTVVYVQELQERVRALEQGRGAKRVRSEDADVLDDAPHPRLPSIASWLHPTRADAPAGQSQLPTPPTSTNLGPTAGAQAPPALALDLPAPSALAQSFMSMAGARAAEPWTHEDASAASLLLQIRSTGSPTQGRGGRGEVVVVGVPRVQTPASLLGLTVERAARGPA